MVKERPAFFYTLALATGVLLYAEWPYLAGFLDLLTIAAVTVVVVAAICCLVIKAGRRNTAILLAMVISGMLCGIMLAAVHDRSDGGGVGLKSEVRQGAAAVRARMMDIYRTNGMEGDELAVVSAMTLGEKRLVDRDLRREYSKTGAAHVLALSGTHLAILYFILTMLMGKGSVASRFILLAAIWCYVIIVGMPVSAVRAAVMLSMFTLADVIRRGYDRMDVLVCAVFLMLLAEPFIIKDVGFQLSVMSVWAIIVVCPLLNGLLPMDFALRHQWLAKLWSMVTVGIAANIGSAPLVAYYFGVVSYWSVVTNLVVLPLTTIMLYGAVAVVVLFPLSLLQTIAVRLVGGVAWLQNTILGVIAELPISAVEGIKMTLSQLVICYIVIALLLRIIKYLQVK